MSGNEVRVHTSTTGNMVKEIKDARSAWEAFQKKGSEGLQIGAGMAVASRAFDLVNVAIEKTVGFMAEGVQGAIDEEAGIDSLTASLRANVKGWDGNTDAIERTIKARERLGFADDEQRDALTGLVARTKDSVIALGLERTAMDLARLRKIDLAQASEIVGKVYSGNVAVLQRYGIAVSNGATSTQALAQIQKMAAGQAKSWADSTKGTIEGLQIEVQDLGEDLGQSLLPAVRDVAKWGRDDLLPFLSAAGATMSDLTDEAEPFVRALKMSVGINPFPTPQDEALAKWKGMVSATRDLADQGQQAYAALRAAKRGAAALGDETQHIRGLGGAANKAAERFGDLRKSVDDAARAIAEAAYGPEELRLEFRRTELELKDNQDALHDVEKKIQSLKDKGKPVPRDLREQFLDLRVSINDNKKSLIETGLKLEHVGGIELTDLKKEFAKLGIPIENVKGDAAELLRLIERLSREKLVRQLMDRGWSGWNDHGKASGGYTPPGDSAVVGERGMEGVKALPGGGFMTFPMDGRGAFGITPQAPVQPLASRAAEPAQTMGGSPIVIQLVAEGRVLSELVAPGVTAWQQRRGL